jgi:hypothetical protein
LDTVAIVTYRFFGQERKAMTVQFQKLVGTIILTVATLAGCGGGGGSNSTVVDKAGAPLSTSAATNMSLAAGASVVHSLTGGGGGSKFVQYGATTSDQNVAKVTLSGTNFTIQGVGAGTATVTLTDNAGGTVIVNVTVPSSANAPSKLIVKSPGSVNLMPGMTTQYQISGGQAPYTTVSSAPGIAVATLDRNMVTVTAANPGTANIVVFDSSGAKETVALVVSTATPAGPAPALFTTMPASVTMKMGMTATYAVGGGTGPYTVASSNADVLEASITGSTLNIASMESGRATLNIQDATGTSVFSSVLVSGDAVNALYTTAPSSISIPVGNAPIYEIIGGVMPYTVSTSNPSVVRGRINSSILSVTGIAAGIADLVVFDANGSTVRINATVGGGTSTVPLYTTAPETITVTVGAAPTYVIAGGAGPYAATSSNEALFTVSQSENTFTVVGVSAGSGTIAIRDASGTLVSINVVIQ